MSAAGNGVWRDYDGGRIPSVLELLPVFYDRLPPQARILDLGCARGRIVFRLRDQGWRRVFGLDINPAAAAIAGQRAAERYGQDDPPRFAVGRGDKTPYRSASFDRVVLQAVLTTVPEPEVRQGIVLEATRLLAPAGTLYLAEYGQTWDVPLYRKRYEEGLKLGLERGAFEAKNTESGEVEFIARHFTGEELVELVGRAGLEVIHHSQEKFTTRTGNVINGHVILARK